MFSKTWKFRGCAALCFAAMIVGLASIASAVPPERIWVDATGQHSVKARLLDIVDEQPVVLLREDGGRIQMSLQNLSDEDQRYVEEYQQVESQPSVLHPAAVEVLIPETLDLPAAESTAACI